MLSQPLRRDTHAEQRLPMIGIALQHPRKFGVCLFIAALVEQTNTKSVGRLGATGVARQSSRE